MSDFAQVSQPEGQAGLDKPRQFVTLDALRGIAAIGVLYFHTSWLLGSGLFGHGYLAVDFFFMLSGFVMTYAYQQRLDQGWPIPSFLTVRIVRLYPLYLLGLLLGLLFQILQNRFGSVGLPAGTTLALLSFGLLLIPSPVQFAGVSGRMYPFNIVSWSLLYEILGNLGHAAFLRRLKAGMLFFLVSLASVALVISARHHRSMDFGADRTEVFWGISRLAFGYLMGISVYRFWRQGKFRPRLPAHFCGLILFGLLAAPAFKIWHVTYDVLVTLLVFPLLLLTSASSEPHSRLARPFKILGLASYAVYVLQLPLQNLFVRAAIRLTSRSLTAFAPWSGITFVAAVIGSALAADRFYDAPVRRYLRKRISTE